MINLQLNEKGRAISDPALDISEELGRSRNHHQPFLGLAKEIPFDLGLLYLDVSNDERELIGWMRNLHPVHKNC